MHSVTPKLVTEIQFAEWTQEGLMRHASFLGLRDDKPARTIVRKVPSPYPTGMMNPNAVIAMPDGRQQSNPSQMGGASKSRSRSSISTAVTGVRITHPHREMGLTAYAGWLHGVVVSCSTDGYLGSDSI